MLDIDFIKQNKEAVIANCQRRKCKVDINELLDLIEKKNAKIVELEALRHEINALSKTKPDAKTIQKLKILKENTRALQEELDKLLVKVETKLSWLPNMLSSDVPHGKDDSENVEVKKWGDLPKFDFTPRDHEDLGIALDILDKERATKVTEGKFYFLKGNGARLTWALYTFAQNLLFEKGFTFFLTPDLAKQNSLFGTGYLPFATDDLYAIQRTGLSLIGTSEQVLVSYHANETMDEKNLPKMYCAFSPCFRTEAGSYGKDTRGIFRVHQFHKLEQIVFCRPEDSEKYMDLCQKNEEDLAEALGIPYRRVLVCDGDMGAPGYKKYDLEGWFPGQNRYRELTSNTNLTDFQTRRLNIKFLNSKKDNRFPHTISATAISDRWVLAILENNQQKDGSVKVPEVLRPYLGNLDVIRPK
ncbi:serine--tRNA ligase [candidate division WWE3 bacterium CG08_land_8_20_14_0_20_40_13]|uniref:Serine--tRNA ligase n=1 Tax=candidate division WWE3 bacterium CG08_land_8_20_14_0_20_40_13 TaxID=1975084 RepID=A0A2H0XGW0_UNCKA|nr:MAG: serine--tRNA ligase [candidate division WWE3 bacterium CG08_land_8_20_14_0_20_40_13]